MKEFLLQMKYYLMGFGAVIGVWIDNISPLVMSLVILITIDYATGVMSAYVSKTLSSSVGFRGIAKKIGELAVVVIAFVIDNAMSLGQVLSTATVLFYIANEGLSILENSYLLGVPIPKQFKKVLQQIVEEDEESE